ncbi:MAG: hypothetical protein HOQ04_08300 [Pseudarthrobacter sp.]|nr:hypothetical protein [Pseudarthrobacter sp.]
MRPKAATPAGQGAGAVNSAAAPLAHRHAAVRVAVPACMAAVAAALVAGAAVIGPPDADAKTLRGFQVRVLSISQAVAENRTDGALAAVQALEKDLDEAAAGGRLSAARYRGIETALAAVRGDLATHVAAAGTSAPDTGTPAAAQSGTPQQEPLPQEAAVPAVAPAPAPARASDPGPSLPDKGKEGKGKEKGQGRP